MIVQPNNSFVSVNKQNGFSQFLPINFSNPDNTPNKFPDNSKNSDEPDHSNNFGNFDLDDMKEPKGNNDSHRFVDVINNFIPCISIPIGFLNNYVSESKMVKEDWVTMKDLLFSGITKKEMQDKSRKNISDIVKDLVDFISAQYPKDSLVKLAIVSLLDLLIMCSEMGKFDREYISGILVKLQIHKYTDKQIVGMYQKLMRDKNAFVELNKK
jgi:hypothetical protein